YVSHCAPPSLSFSSLPSHSLDPQMFPSMSEQSSYKIVIDGAKKSGKSSILRRISKNEFVDQPLRADTDSLPHIVTHSVCIEGPRLVHLEIWERVPSIDIDALYENVDASVFTYDITSRNSFEKCVSRLRKMRGRTKGRGIYGLVGCKSDQVDEREIEMEEALDLARKESLDFCLEVSSKTPVNIPGVCTIIARKLEKRKEKEETPTEERHCLHKEDHGDISPQPLKKRLKTFVCCL
ncbi:hypothetical protein PMAYCL1PPCAC_02633, partial [Pristionchus mayeri]